MRICHLISGDLWAGAEIVAATLLERLRGLDGIGLDAVLLNEGKLAAEIRLKGVPVSVLDERNLSAPALAGKIRNHVRTIRPDVIHAHRYKENLLAWAAVAGTGRRGPRLVATQHGMPEIHARASALRQRMISRMNFLLLSRRFDAVVAVSNDICGTFVSRLGFRPERVRVVRNGILLPRGAGPRRQNDRCVIGSMGRFFPVKDYPFMVKVARAVADVCPDVRFELGGDGPSRGEIEASIARHDLGDRFQLHGVLDDTDGFYSGLDLFLNTSVHEGIPVSVLEAMGHGIPVVAPRVGGLLEIVRDGMEGFLVAGRDPRQFAEACLRLARDRDLRDRMGAFARRRVAESFSADGMAKGYIEVYRDVLA